MYTIVLKLTLMLTRLDTYKKNGNLQKNKIKAIQCE